MLRKLLASSTFAIAGALDSLIRRLNQALDEKSPVIDIAEELDQDFEALDEIADLESFRAVSYTHLNSCASSPSINCISNSSTKLP